MKNRKRTTSRRETGLNAARKRIQTRREERRPARRLLSTSPPRRKPAEKSANGGRSRSVSDRSTPNRARWRMSQTTKKKKGGNTGPPRGGPATPPRPPPSPPSARLLSGTPLPFRQLAALLVTTRREETLEPTRLEELGRKRRSRLLVKRSRRRPGNVPLDEALHEKTPSAAGECDREPVARAHELVRGRGAPVQVHLAPRARRGSLRPCRKKARDVQPYVQTDLRKRLLAFDTWWHGGRLEDGLLDS